MRKSQITVLIPVVLFVFLLVSYRFSLYHETSQLPYLSNPSLPLFQKILTYTFTTIGVLPTLLLILYTSILCSTSAASGVIQTTCFGKPFAVSDSSGFFAYIVACLAVAVAVWYMLSVLFEAAPRKQK